MASERARDAIELLHRKIQSTDFNNESFKDLVLDIRKTLDSKVCHTCNKAEDKDHGVTLSCCPKCKAVGRKVLYCSRCVPR